jgi:NDP-sugar pyrophosphorylase family protein
VTGLLGLLLAAGRSTRTQPQFIQKNAVEVLWGGEVKSVIRHQIDALLPLVDKLYVVVWHEKELYGKLEGVHILEYEPRGIGDVWRRFLADVSEAEVFMSVNCDDLHTKWDYVKLASRRRAGISVLYARNPAAIDSSTAYEVNSNLEITRVLGKHSGLRRAWIGTGVYILERAHLEKVEYKANEKTGEVEPDDVLRQLIDRGVKLHAYPVATFAHVGEPQQLWDLHRAALRAKGELLD